MVGVGATRFAAMPVDATTAPCITTVPVVTDMFVKSVRVAVASQSTVDAGVRKSI